MHKCKYLGSVLSHDGNGNADVRSRIKSIRCKWRELTESLCNKNIPSKLKSKVFKIVIRLVMMYRGSIDRDACVM